jgi:hypothetical protein
VSLRTVLLDIERLFRHVSSAHHLRSTVDRDTERWVGSKAPCDTRTLAVLDRRTKQLTKHDELSPERVLRCWVYAVLDAQFPMTSFSADLPMPRTWTVTILVATLLSDLPWIVQQESVVRFARHMAAVRRQLQIIS